MEIISLIKRLLETRSITGEENNILIEIEDIIYNTNLEIKRIPVDKDRWNLIVLKKGKTPGILFCGHIDTVPSKFSSPKIKDNYLFGLGASDMKSAIGVFLKCIQEDPSNYRHGVLVTVGEEKADFDGIIGTAAVPLWV